MANRQFVSEPKQRIKTILRARLPWLLLGLLGGTLASLVVSQFEKIISQNISLAFFVPVIVYMSDAIGTQTETIFVRDLATSKLLFLRYLLKESLVALFLGLILGTGIALVSYLWLGSFSLSLIVGLTMLINATISPFIALLIPELLYKEKTDPALGAGPFATILQDIISLIIYFLIASLVLKTI